jgi:hypothetical protein
VFKKFSKMTMEMQNNRGKSFLKNLGAACKNNVIPLLMKIITERPYL